ncbi:signal peptidase complex subunit spc2 [Elasticomyces elasticus]|uniref:Signal peptidase complex subunit 2 n=1 Tax=Exophiala sideris TaxID=1016849 RepID=A0ABR0J472_9EURO|nr:signal peptidase complex subunit spc2 [Elasticomyces elasticus]KAK5026992.1 signal peptidase complex subunit spc2 [Exophiala sideris]KAK5033996.1 signal peptidase complex subunit spc2 [Exophiala sideris]KAK5055730.1 signal peptidase complex subunit spc2 [Exophiala sideris]KAK5180938.1 signal peptidase complex subunit spc2 [Eurotiomycetes sp. CCFEE 6388]
MSSPAQKVSLYSVNDLKNATDDAIAPYLTSLPKPYTFKQQHYTTNVRLILGYTAVTIAGILFYADWKLGWDATKAYTAPACIAYFVLNGALTYWIWAVEAGTIFVGTREGGQKLTLKSSSQKYKPLYKLKVAYEAPSGKKWENKEVEGSFTQWFNTHGYLQKKELQAWLAENIEVLGVARSEGKSTIEVDTPLSTTEAIDDATLAAMSFSSGNDTSSAGPPSAKKGRGKKKT